MTNAISGIDWGSFSPAERDLCRARNKHGKIVSMTS